MNSKKILSFILPAAALIVLLAYFNIALDIIRLSDKLTLILAFAIGPVAIYGILNISRKLSLKYDGEMLRAATVFLVIAFAFFSLMLIVQQSIFAYFQQYRAATDDPAIKESLGLSFKWVNPVQLGMDISFDIFYCIGTILFALVIISLRGFYRIMGIYGVISALGLLVFYIWTFPVPPADSGMVDFGPLSALFWLIFIAYEIIAARRLKSSSVSA